MLRVVSINTFTFVNKMHMSFESGENATTFLYNFYILLNWL